ncbi:MAG: hypothetical protein ACLTY5_08080 [Angelakisella sp.]
MRGLSACGRVILPAVFPFLAVSVFLAGAPGGAGLAALLSGVMRYCFRLPAAAAPALLMSWIGGYPAGAKTLAELRRQGALTARETEEAAPVLIYSGPAYGRGGGRPHFRLHGGGDFFVPVPAGGGSAAGAAVCPGPAAAAQREPLAVFSQNRAGRGAAGTVSGFGGFLGGEYLRLCGAAFGLCGSIFRLRAVPFAGEGTGFTYARGMAGETAHCFFTGLSEICAGSALSAELPLPGRQDPCRFCFPLGDFRFAVRFRPALGRSRCPEESCCEGGCCMGFSRRFWRYRG